MKLTRRQFSMMTLGAAAAAGVAPLALAQRGQRGTFFDWKPLPNGARAGFGGGGNVMVVASDNQAMLIDCKNFGLGGTLRREAGAFGGELTTVVNTHHHGDHSGGNSAFTKDLPIVAQEKARDRVVTTARGNLDRYKQSGDAGAERLTSFVLDNANTAEGGKWAHGDVKRFLDNLSTLQADSFAPTQTFDKEHELRVGSLAVQLRHIGPGHTDNDLFVFIPELNLLHTGDLLFHKLHPFIDMGAGASSAGWIRSCEAMLSVCDDKTVVVPGHGELADRTGIVEQKEYFQQLRDAMAEAHKKGMSRNDAIEIELPIFKNYGFEQIKARTLGSVYDEMQGE